MIYKNKSLLTKKKAFTLIELLIVIAIIGILFIVLVSKVDFATDKAKATGVQTDFRSFQVAIESVAKEHAGLATFGWDTGDTNGNRIRDSYDKGDTNKNGKQDPGEIFVGSKVYGETWTNIYTLTNPADANDTSAMAALEAAINKNLDPKLHITIHDNLTITMANGAQDPWNTEYHGYYITNATVDNKDRGAIVIYSNGANQEFGSDHSIANGVVTVNVPGNNVYGKDDYSIAIVYTYANGYGEVKTVTSGFSNNMNGNISDSNNMHGNTSDSITDLSDIQFIPALGNRIRFKTDVTNEELLNAFNSVTLFTNGSEAALCMKSDDGDVTGAVILVLVDGEIAIMAQDVTNEGVTFKYYFPSQKLLDLADDMEGVQVGWNDIILDMETGDIIKAVPTEPYSMIYDENWVFMNEDGFSIFANLFTIDCEHEPEFVKNVVVTCTEPGGEQYICNKCNSIGWKNKISPKQHVYNNLYICTNCNQRGEKQYEEITDSWDEIIAYVNDGSYIYRYGIGAYKTLVVDGKNIDMKIASIVGDDILTDDDVATNSAESVHITWIATTGLTLSTHSLNNDEKSGGWQCSLIREKLNNEIYSDLSADIKNAIVAVNKTSGGGSADTSDLLWILSGREVGFTGSAFASSGPVYSQLFTDNASRKNDSTYSHGYWLRDAHYDISDGAGWKIVSSDGYETVSPTYWSSYILFGFCI